MENRTQLIDVKPTRRQQNMNAKYVQEATTMIAKKERKRKVKTDRMEEDNRRDSIPEEIDQKALTEEVREVHQTKAGIAKDHQVDLHIQELHNKISRCTIPIYNLRGKIHLKKLHGHNLTVRKNQVLKYSKNLTK